MLTFQATWSLANTPIVVFITVIFFSIVFSCSVLCKFCVFFFFYLRAAVSVVFFHLAVLFRFYRMLVVCIMYFYLIRFGATPERDRQTDGHRVTAKISLMHYYASRGKKCNVGKNK